MLTADSILGPDGSIASRLPNYRFRPQQLKMAEAVAEALTSGRHLVVEAGTGVGKSFAYLVPSILAVTADSPAVRRVIVSTHTISLQEQLLTKDLPLLNAVIPREFTAVLAKGRGNYVSLRRLQRAASRQESLFDYGEERRQLQQLRQWVQHTTDGSISDMPFEPRGALWQEIQSDQNNCRRTACPHYEQCFFYRARKRIEHAQILVVNHALFFSDLALKSAELGGVLPPYDAVVIDEAHTMESVAAEHFGVHVGSGQVAFQLNRLFNPRNNSGLLAEFNDASLQRAVSQCASIADEWFAGLYEWARGQAARSAPDGSPVRIRECRYSPAPLTEALQTLSRQLQQAAKDTDNAEQEMDLRAAASRLADLRSAVITWASQSLEELVYWLTPRMTRRGFERIDLMAAPIDVAESLQRHLFDSVDSVIMASATLATGHQGDFSYFCSRIGVRDAKTLQVGSPFDYPRQARLVLVKGLPDPSAQRNAFESACLELLPHYILQSRGRAFCLFTSYSMLKRAASKLDSWAEEHGIGLFAQGMGTPRHQLLEQFKAHEAGVLLGTSSFWQGVDVPGDDLQNVIITKLPFSVPDHPLVEAKLEAIRARKGNPFVEYQLPEAVIRLKQGFGRLIRSSSDEGSVVILDPRLLTKRYGKLFLQALPQCPVSVDECDARGNVLASVPLESF